jgi:hypothetical protein
MVEFIVHHAFTIELLDARAYHLQYRYGIPVPAGPDYRCCILSSPYHDTTQLAFSSFTTPVILSQKMTFRSYITSFKGHRAAAKLAGLTQ